MLVEQFLDLARGDVLAAADDDLLQPPGDAEVAVGLAQGDVAGVQPTVGVDGLGRGLGHVIVAQHHVVAPAAEFAGGAVGKLLARERLDDLHFDAGKRPAHRADAIIDRIVGAGHGNQRRGLGLTVGDGDFAGPHVLGDALHDLDGARAARHDARPQRR